MLELPIGRLVHIYQRLAATNQLLVNWSNAVGPPTFENKAYKDVKPAFLNGDYLELRDLAEEFCGLCLQVSFVVTHETAKKVCEDIKRATYNVHEDRWSFDKSARLRLEGSLNGLIICMRSEASTKTAMILPPEKLHLFAPTAPIFGVEVRAKFAAAIFDIDEGAKCLALSRSMTCPLLPYQGFFRESGCKVN